MVNESKIHFKLDDLHWMGRFEYGRMYRMILKVKEDLDKLKELPINESFGEFFEREVKLNFRDIDDELVRYIVIDKYRDEKNHLVTYEYSQRAHEIRK